MFLPVMLTLTLKCDPDFNTNPNLTYLTNSTVMKPTKPTNPKQYSWTIACGMLPLINMLAVVA